MVHVELEVKPESRLLVFPPRKLEARHNGYLNLYANSTASVDTIWLINTAQEEDATGLLVVQR